MKKEVLILGILVLAGVFLFGCKPAEKTIAPETETPETPETEAAEAPVEEPAAPAPTLETPEEEKEVPTEAKSTTETTVETPTEPLSNFVCDKTKGVIEAVLTNTYNETLTIGDDIKLFYINYFISNPGCEKTELAPGESTKCTNLNGNYRVVPRPFFSVKVNREYHKYSFDCEEYAPTKEASTEETETETE